LAVAVLLPLRQHQIVMNDAATMLMYVDGPNFGELSGPREAVFDLGEETL